MIFDRMLINTIKIQTNIFNLSFNLFNSILEQMEAALMISAPVPIKSHMYDMIALGEIIKERYNVSVNHGLEKMENLYTQS